MPRVSTRAGLSRIARTELRQGDRILEPDRRQCPPSGIPYAATRPPRCEGGSEGNRRHRCQAERGSANQAKADQKFNEAAQPLGLPSPPSQRSCLKSRETRSFRNSTGPLDRAAIRPRWNCVGKFKEAKATESHSQGRATCQEPLFPARALSARLRGVPDSGLSRRRPLASTTRSVQRSTPGSTPVI